MSSLTREKLEQAGAILRESDCDAWLVFDRETAEGGDPVLPLITECGLTWQSALLIGRRQRLAVVGNFDADALRASGDWDEVIPYVEGIRSALLEALDRLVPAQRTEPRIAVDYALDDDKCDGLSHGMYLLLERYLAGTRFARSLTSAQAIAGSLRSRKTPEELRRIRGAIEETETRFAEIDTFARIGLSEREIYDFVQQQIDRRGLGYGWSRANNPIVNAGPDSMIGHGVPSAEVRLAAGHILHLDLGVVAGGYSADIQRCWYAPRAGEAEPPEEVAHALAAVNGAISAGAAAIRPGAEGWRVDAQARAAIQDAGYAEYMHALGHQVGRLAHDGGAVLGPRWDRYGRMPSQPLQAAQVFTLELGVMVPAHGYLGLEEMVRVTETGCEWLTDRQLLLRWLA
jgi:Xaa-Pro dipeptidase